MPRFFVDEEPKGEVLLTGETGRHIVKVLRMRPGEELTLCAGTGKDFPAVLTECRAEGALVRVEGETPSLGEAETQVTVCMGWPKGDKLETVAQKSVELGAVALRPVFTDRCVSRPKGAALEKRLLRLARIMREAAQQSGRGIIPRVLPPMDLPAALNAARNEGDVLFFYEHGRESLREALAQAGKRLSVFVGPEGGFSPEEAALAEEMGAPLLTLGPRILRTETAPLAALAAVLYDRGEFERRA